MSGPLFTLGAGGNYDVLLVYRVELDSLGEPVLSCRLVSTHSVPGEEVTVRGDDSLLKTFKLAPYVVPPRHLVSDSLRVLQWATTTPSLLLVWEARTPIPAMLTHLPWVLPGDETRLGQSLGTE